MPSTTNMNESSSECVRPADLMADGRKAQGVGGHRKGTTSAFFLNAEYALRVQPTSDYDKKRQAACEEMMRLQMVDIVKSNSVGTLYHFRDADMQRIMCEEITKRAGEAVQPFDRPRDFEYVDGEAYGFTGQDFLAKHTDVGLEGGSEGGHSHFNDKLLLRDLARAKGVRKATMAAFNANYRLLKKDPSNGAALDVMKELLPMVIQLNYFRWWTCTDDWVQAIVDAAQATYDEEHGTNSARGP